jgi:SOS response regulatory protein OraA/RecX
MLDQYRRKFGDEPAESYADRAKRARYLQNRGFPADWVMRVESMDDY